MKIKCYKMKKTLLYTLFFLTLSFAGFSQQMNREKIKLLKTSYITDALDLTPDEAEKFWPVYNLYTDRIQKSKFQLESQFFRDIRNSGGIDGISDEKANDILEASIELEKEITKDKVEMVNELKNVLPAKKILKLRKAERDFNKRVLQEYGKRKRMQEN